MGENGRDWFNQVEKPKKKYRKKNPKNNTYAFRNTISFSFTNPAESEDDSEDVAVISFKIIRAQIQTTRIIQLEPTLSLMMLLNI